MNKVIIYSPYRSPKLTYVLDYVWTRCLGFEFVLTDDKAFFLSAEIDIKLNYSADYITGVMAIPFSNYFIDFDTKLIPQIEKNLHWDEKGRTSFDFLAGMFFLLARVEEYGEVARDEHSRYVSDQSVLVKLGLLDYPVIDGWVQELRLQLNQQYDLSLSTPTYKCLSTVDVDHISAFKNKPLPIQLGGLTKDLLSGRFARMRDRFSKKDPYHRIGDMIDWNTELGLDLLFFVLTTQRSKHDKSLLPTHPVFIDTIKNLSQNGELGIHPSYASWNDTPKIKAEKSTLEKILDQPIHRSRQHFLRLSFPTTYKQLIDAGITEDYSMGYPDRLGFRAGTSRPFQWYDLDSDEVTTLTVVPFMIMDVTLNKYLKLDAGSAVQHCKQLIENTKAVGGQTSIIWHNSSFYAEEGWLHWEESYRRILQLAVS